MPTPRPEPLIARLAPWLLALSLVACNGAENRAIENAQARLERGDLEDARRGLEGYESTSADLMRRKIAAAVSHRLQVRRSLQEIRMGALEHDREWSRRELDALSYAEHDPGTAALIEELRSDLASELAGTRIAASSSAPGSPTALREGEARAANPATASATLSPAQATLAEARDAQAREQWKLALALAADAQRDRASAKEARLLRDSILDAARDEADALRATAKELARSVQPEEVERILARELQRFPDSEEFDELRFELELLTARDARADQARPPPSPARARSAPLVAAGTAAGGRDATLTRAVSPFECAAIAQSRASMGELPGAMDAWLEAARRKTESPWREECERRARECEMRIALREELADFARIDSDTAGLLGWKAAGDDAGAPKFESISLTKVSRAVDRARVSKKARLGWLIESIARGDESERAQALLELGPCVERKELDAEHASCLVAQAKGEVAEAGWVFKDGRWVEGSLARKESAAAEEALRAEKYAALLGDFRRSTAVERDRLFARVREVGDPELVAKALTLRWQDGWEKLERNPNLRQLALLADDRRALDAAREKALALIFDEERYFYPYDPPECPPDKASKYAAVQREVDERVNAVHDAWGASRPVKIGDALRQQLAQMAWTTERAAEAGIELPPVPAELRFALVLPAENSLGLPQFAWDAAERAALTESRRIEARNERLWAALMHAKQADDVPGADEQQQVTITNAYRRMLGRRALAWNPKLEAAAQGHSDHMANSGEFGHFESGDPSRRTPNDRMKLAGYGHGISENVSMGRGDPKSAHEGWTHSSGHHRNLLMADQREMASAIASSYWTQNFGMDTSFLADL